MNDAGQRKIISPNGRPDAKIKIVCIPPEFTEGENELWNVNIRNWKKNDQKGRKN